MSTFVYKYPIEVQDEIVIRMPPGEVLDVQMQHGEPCVWVRVDPQKPHAPRKFRIYGTGHEIKDDSHLEYIGTFQIMGGNLVFHLFEVKE